VTIRLEQATSPADLDAIRALFREYADSLGVNLDYQGFEEELRGLPGDYASPSGMLLLARINEEAVGCVGVRPLDTRVAEMKRLYVRPSARGTGLGRTLTEAAIEFARQHRYAGMRLDTLPTMERAQELYRQLGFVTIAPYRFSPVPGTVFMEKVFEEDRG
jgi:ribosomal protein S18 acetylase RimI-like enzyme